MNIARGSSGSAARRRALRGVKDCARGLRPSAPRKHAPAQRETERFAFLRESAPAISYVVSRSSHDNRVTIITHIHLGTTTFTR